MIGRVAAANAVPEAQCSPDLLKKLGDEGEDKPEPTKLSTQQRQELLLAALEKDGGLDRLKDWPPELAKRAKALLLEFHHVFSLEPNEIGCTDATKHVIELMKDEPFKERFHRIAPPLVDEVRQHIQEMLDGSAIRPSQSPWCNAVVLMRKKDGSFRFCIDFRRLNAQTKKDAYPLPRMQETMESMVGTPTLLLHGPEERVFGKFRWMRSLGNTPPSRWVAWVCMSSCVCPTGCAMLQRCSSVSCRTAWGS